MDHNKSILYKLYSRQAVKKKVLKLIEVVDFNLRANKCH